MSSNPSLSNIVLVVGKEEDTNCDANITKSRILSASLDKEDVLSFTTGIDEAVVTRKELWSYYLYLNGNSGVVPFIYLLAFFQSLITAGGYDPVLGPGSSCAASNASGQCVVPWGSGTMAVSSVILLANSISFAIMTVIFTAISATADYGTLGRWLLLVVTCINWASQFACMSLTAPSRWPAALGLYIISFISFGAMMVFYMSVFPRLARNTRRANQIRDKFDAGQMGRREYEIEESLEKNRISNISMVHYTIGFTIVACLNLALLIPLKDNPLVNNYIIVLMTGYSVAVGGWWFVFQQPRPGPPLPKGESYLFIGWKQIWTLLKEYKKLPQMFIYTLAFFLLSDGFNTTGTLASILQNEEFEFSFLQITYLGLAQSVPSAMGTLGFWYIQLYWKISTKKMFAVTNVVAVLIPLWGMIGIWTDKIGFHHPWEFWVYNVVFGLFQAPYYAFSQTMMAELTPPGFDYLFFGLFGLSNRASSMIGPNVIQAIINKTGNNWTGFPFLFALCAVASGVIWFGVDVKRGRRDAARWAAERRIAGAGVGAGAEPEMGAGAVEMS